MSEPRGAIERFMSEDHARIEGLLATSQGPDGTLDEHTFTRFRHDLLRHIGMEEKPLVPFARSSRGGEPLEVAAQLRRDHGQIARMLATRPSPAGLAALRELLARHNPLEEGTQRLYATCDALAGADAEALVARLCAQPDVPLAPYWDGPLRVR